MLKSLKMLESNLESIEKYRIVRGILQMIIPRKYEWLGVLYENDADVKEIVNKAFSLVEMTPEWKKELLEYNHFNIPAFLNLGCGIPGESYSYIIKEFELLDKEKPYDNGLNFKDVSSIEYETSRKGSAIQMRFVSQHWDGPYRIVGFASIENKDSKNRIGKGWEMVAPFEIG